MELFHIMLLLIPIMYVLALCVGLYIAICPMKTSVTPRSRRNRAIPDCVRGADNAAKAGLEINTGRVGVARPIAGERS